MPQYIPHKGDFVALSFNPQSGHEQKGRRPALVISNDLFNQKTGLALVCPITNTNRKYPFHLRIPDNCVLTGFIMMKHEALNISTKLLLTCWQKRSLCLMLVSIRYCSSQKLRWMRIFSSHST
jgi:hypothetical protein